MTVQSAPIAKLKNTGASEDHNFGFDHSDAGFAWLDFASSSSAADVYEQLAEASDADAAPVVQGVTLTDGVVDQIQIDGDSAPPTGNGSLQTMADYLRVGYWTDTGRAARSWAGGNVTYNLTDLTAAEANLARSAMGLWSSIANINFSETTGSAQITFNNNGSGSAGASSTTSGGNLTAVTIGISGDWWPNDAYDEYMYQTYIHEIGHAIGLGHQGPYNNTATYPNNANWFNDSWRMSIMSYFDQAEAGTGSYAFVTGPQLADIRAIQDIYGARTTTRTGDTTYGYNGTAGISYNFTALGSATSFTVYDNGGTDTLNGSGTSANQIIDLRSGNSSSMGGETNNVTIWINTVVENAIGGSGADTFYGNTSNNVITGGSGTDTFVFAGNRTDFTLVESNNFGYTVTGATSTGSAQGTDTLNSIERFIFNDVVVTDDYMGGISTAGVISANNVAVTGTSQFRGDQDWFRVTLEAGHNYVISQRGTVSGLGTLPDPLVRLYNSAGSLITSNDDGGHGLESQLAIRVTTTGTYYVSAGNFSSNFGTYSLTVEEQGIQPGIFPIPSLELAQFGNSPAAGDWGSQELTLRQVGDVDGDGLADIVGFGYGGVIVSLATYGGGFAPSTVELPAFGNGPPGGGWDSNDRFPRLLGDVNGDGLDDIVGFSYGGLVVSLATGGGHFATQTAERAAFGAGPDAGGWSNNNSFPRVLADVNSDGRADVVGFSYGGVVVSLATGDGHFAAQTFELAAFGSGPDAGGWSNNNDFPRLVGDVSGDGIADIVGFGYNGVVVSLGTGNGHFAIQTNELAAFGAGPNAGGWANNNLYPRILADVNGDGRMDIVGFGYTGVSVALATGGGHFATPTFEGAEFGLSDAGGGWASQNLYPRLAGDVTGDGRTDIIGFSYAGVTVSQSHEWTIV